MIKKLSVILFLVIAFLLFTDDVQAQCSICTKTAQQLGEKSAKGLNAGIIYLAFTPLALIGIIAYRWHRNNKDTA